MEAINGALEAPEMDDLYGAMEAIDMDCPKTKMVTKEELSPKQKEMVQQFHKDDKDEMFKSRQFFKLRERVLPLLKPEQDNENYLVKWLIARKFNLDMAEDMLRKHIRYLKINKLDDMENYVPPEAFQYFYTAMLGYDKEGSIVRVLHVGASDIRGLCYALSKIDCLKFAYYTLKCDSDKQKLEKENEGFCDKQVYIIDLQGLSWSAVVQRIVINRTLMLLKSYEANHPERLKVAYIVNVPSFFSFIYNWLKTILPDSIISKLDIVSPDEYLTKLGTVIDLSVLPAIYGGTRRDPDGNPACTSLFLKPLGTPVPEKLLSTDNMENLKNDPNAKRITVEYKSRFIVEKEVLEPNSILQWDFQTLDYDIRMGLCFRRDEKSNSEEIIPPHRVDSHLFPESGSFMCENPGIYEIVFDNTYSWMTSKELIVKVSLDAPRKDTDEDD